MRQRIEFAYEIRQKLDAIGKGSAGIRIEQGPDGEILVGVLFIDGEYQKHPTGWSNSE